jgi:VCBS repeat protein
MFQRRLPTFRFARPVVFALVVVFAAQNGWAVIRVDAPVTQTYELAKIVLIGRIVRIDANERIVEAEVVKVSKGDFAGGKVQINLSQVSDYFHRVELNQPVVIFSGLKSALVHLGDNFLSAEPDVEGQPCKFKITKVNPIEPRFPGRTTALVRLIDEIAAGHSTLLNMIEHVVWNGGVRSWGKVLPNADYVIAVDLNGDGKAEVTLGNPQATELLFNTGNGFKDETLKWGLRHARGRWAASGDINGDGKVDLLIGRQFWRNEGRHFAPGPVLPISGDDDILAVALADATGDGRLDALFLRKNGELVVFENPGASGKEWKALPVKKLWSGGEEAVAAAFSTDWGDTSKPHVMVARTSGLTRYALNEDDGPPADFERLTGESLNRYNEVEGLASWNVVTIVPLDINGDGHEDLVVILDKGGPTLVNRGFGTFFLNPLPTEALHASYQKDVPWKVTPKTRFGAGDIHGDKFDDLLIVTPEGKLFELNNTPYERTSNRFR